MADREWDEIERLREWRHHVVTPALSAYDKLLSNLAERMERIEPKVEAVWQRDEFADWLDAFLQRKRARWYKRVEVWATLGMFFLGAVEIVTRLHG